MKLTDLRDNEGARKTFKRRGKGIGSGKGKTSGRGGKGQTARSGVAINGFEGGQTPIHRRLPKRGFKSLNKTIFSVVNLDTISALIGANKISVSDLFTKEKMVECGLIKSKSKIVKILAKGELEAPVNIEADFCSKEAISKITKAGGSFTATNSKN